jgi:hypothetical protein
MKNYFEHRGMTQQLIFDPVSKQFVTRSAPHPFATQRDPLEQHLLADLGIDTTAIDRGEIKFAT